MLTPEQREDLRRWAEVAEGARDRIAHTFARWRILRKKSEIDSLSEDSRVLKFAKEIADAATATFRKRLRLPEVKPE